MFKVVRADSNQKQVIFEGKTEEEAKDYFNECLKWDTKRIYEYYITDKKVEYKKKKRKRNS